MSDYNPNNFDKYGNPTPPANNGVYEPTDGTGRAPYVLLGLLALVAIVGGTLYFNGGTTTGAGNVATAPAPVIDHAAPANRLAPTARPLDATPAPTTAPAPGSAPATTQP